MNLLKELEMNNSNRNINIQAGNVVLNGELMLPFDSQGIVIFAHGTGSSRFSPRNQYVAKALVQMGLGALLMDLLTEEEEHLDNKTKNLRFDINMLAARVVSAIDWIDRNNQQYTIPIGLFGASTGAGAALVAAAKRDNVVKAVVSRGGRPDLAGDSLPLVKAPTLLIVGAKDYEVNRLNDEAAAMLTCANKTEIIPNATHLFEEPGALEKVAELAGLWFKEYLR